MDNLEEEVVNKMGESSANALEGKANTVEVMDRHRVRLASDQLKS